MSARLLKGSRTATSRADGLVKAVFDSIADLPAPEHLVGLANDLAAGRGALRLA